MLKLPVRIARDTDIFHVNGILEEVRNLIMLETAKSNYDHRPTMPDRVKQLFPHMLERDQLQYARFKRAVTKVLQPESLVEIGTGWGVSARAFLDGHPDLRFHGIDNGEMGVPPEEVLGDLIGPKVTLETVETDALASLTPAGWSEVDLIHIDGGHGREQKARDIVKALQSRPTWILVDDIHDVMVAAGTFDGLYRAAANPLRMLSFENSHTGNLLIFANQREAVER